MICVAISGVNSFRMAGNREIRTPLPNSPGATRWVSRMRDFPGNVPGAWARRPISREIPRGDRASGKSAVASNSPGGLPGKSAGNFPGRLTGKFPTSRGIRLGVFRDSGISWGFPGKLEAASDFPGNSPGNRAPLIPVGVNFN